MNSNNFCTPSKTLPSDILSDLYDRYWNRLQIPGSDEVLTYDDFKLNWKTWERGLPKQLRDNCWKDISGTIHDAVEKPDGNNYDGV